MMRTDVMGRCQHNQRPHPHPPPHPEGVWGKLRWRQRDEDAHTSAAAACCFDCELAAERLNAFLHAAKPETGRLARRNAVAVVAHRQFEPCRNAVLFPCPSRKSKPV